jgi:hypothetical protein
LIEIEGDRAAEPYAICHHVMAERRGRASDGSWRELARLTDGPETSPTW